MLIESSLRTTHTTFNYHQKSHISEAEICDWCQSINLDEEDTKKVVQQFLTYKEEHGHLNLNYCNLRSLNGLVTLLKKLPNLKILELIANKIETIESNSFLGLNNLEYLNLACNKLDKIQKGMFNGLDNLQKLEVHSNPINTVGSMAFDGCSHQCMVNPPFLRDEIPRWLLQNKNIKVENKYFSTQWYGKLTSHERFNVTMRNTLNGVKLDFINGKIYAGNNTLNFKKITSALVYALKKGPVPYNHRDFKYYDDFCNSIPLIDYSQLDSYPKYNGDSNEKIKNILEEMEQLNFKINPEFYYILFTDRNRLQFDTRCRKYDYTMFEKDTYEYGSSSLGYVGASLNGLAELLKIKELSFDKLSKINKLMINENENLNIGKQTKYGIYIDNFAIDTIHEQMEYTIRTSQSNSIKSLQQNNNQQNLIVFHAGTFYWVNNKITKLDFNDNVAEEDKINLINIENTTVDKSKLVILFKQFRLHQSFSEESENKSIILFDLLNILPMNIVFKYDYFYLNYSNQNDAIKVVVSYVCKEEIVTTFNNYLNLYKKNIAEAGTTEEKIAAIILFTFQVECSHFFINGNGRLCSQALLSKLLIDNQLHPTVLFNPWEAGVTAMILVANSVINNELPTIHDLTMCLYPIIEWVKEGQLFYQQMSK